MDFQEASVLVLLWLAFVFALVVAGLIDKLLLAGVAAFLLRGRKPREEASHAESHDSR